MQSKEKQDRRSLTAKKIFIVEDHPIFRKGIVQMLSGEPEFEVCGEAEDSREALALIKKTPPDLVIIDISLKNSSGIELIKDIRALYPDMMMLALSMHDENIYAERVVRSGARGYIMKDAPPEVLLSAVKQVFSGRVYVSENISAKMLDRIAEGRKNESSSPVDILSDRELEVFKLIGSGDTTRRIAEKLGISIKTVENHRAHIKDKMNIENSIELIQQATIWVRESGRYV